MATFEVTSPDGQVFEVTAPEDASEADLRAFVQQNIAREEAEEAANARAVEENTGFFAGLDRGARTIDESLAQTIGGFTGNQELLDYAAEERARVYIPEEQRAADFGDVSEAWTDPNVGILGALDVTQKAMRTGAGEMLGGMLPAIGGGVVGGLPGDDVVLDGPPRRFSPADRTPGAIDELVPPDNRVVAVLVALDRPLEAAREVLAQVDEGVVLDHARLRRTVGGVDGDTRGVVRG